jgi:predicted permease
VLNLGALYRRFRALTHRADLDRDLADELAFHVAMRQAEYERDGLDTRQAGARARRQFGNLALYGERARDEWIPPGIQAALQDLGFAIRLLLKQRRFSLAAITALALGIGATTTALTFVDGVMLEPLPLDAPDRLVTIRTVDARHRPLGVSFADVRDWRDGTGGLAHVISSLDFAMNVSEPSLPAARYLGSYISIDAFQMIGRLPVLGRSFLPEDDRFEAPRVAIIADTVWRNRYGADPAIVGRNVRVNDAPTTIVGVMPPGVHFPMGTEIWMPASYGMGQPATIDARRGNRGVTIAAYGRLAEGVTLAQADAEINAVAARLARTYPATNDGISVALEPIDRAYKGDLPRAMLLTTGAVVFVLLIACVNVGNLLLARAAVRSREMAIRSAVGATKRRILRQLFIESSVLTFVAGAIGLALAFYGTRLFANALIGTNDGPPPFWMHFAINGRVLTMLTAICAAISVAFGLAPALHATPASGVLNEDSRSASVGRRRSLWTSGLLGAQLALTLILLASAALMFRSFLVVYRAGQVLDTSNLVTMRLALGNQRYRDPDQIRRFHRDLDAVLGQSHSFDSSTVSSDLPLMTLTNSVRQLTIAGRTPSATDADTVSYAYIGPRYFETLGVRLLRGRPFDEHDGVAGEAAAIVNQRFVSMFFPDGDPIGARIRLGDAAAPNAPAPWFTIVGVAPTLPQFVAAETAAPMVYTPTQGEPAPHRFATVVARYKGDPGAAIAALRDEIRKVDPDLPGYFVQTMDQALAAGRAPYRVFGSVFGLMAAIAVVLATVGVYALTAHSVTERTHEIGIRMALGARAGEVIVLFVRRTVLHLIAGLTVGLAGAIVAGHMLEQLLVRTPPTDPLVLGIVSILLTTVAVTASYWPARRAARVNPVRALHAE